MSIDPNLVIPMTEVSDEFLQCWRSVGKHLQSMPTNYNFRFHNLSPAPPWLEHFCFSLGNQIFFICIEDVDGQLQTPTDAGHCIHNASQIGGIPCVIQVQEMDGNWHPVLADWGLIHAQTRQVIDPPTHVTPARVEITEWELQDLAVDHVCEFLRRGGCEIQSRSSDPRIVPSIFYSRDGEQSFVGVFSARFPRTSSPQLDRLHQISEQIGSSGSYALVTIASEFDAFDPDETNGFPLYRGDGFLFKFDGLIDL
ncbi:hypothetical protein N9393_01355 [Luminiphilus sp.]|nr:hypothetical protein [Luminiphilus sp.]